MTAPAATDLSPDELLAANVNPVTRLATDYLNVFNEAVMLVGLVGDCPEMFDELKDWRPISYTEHFAAGHFQAHDVVLAAYESCDPNARAMFDAASEALGELISETIADMANAIEKGDDVAMLAGERSQLVRDHISELDGMIHGGDGAVPGGEVVTAQDAVDALFD